MPNNRFSLLLLGFFAALVLAAAPTQAQCILGGLYDEDAVDTTLFGSAVEIDSGVLVVGAMLDTTATEWGSGRVHVYRESEGEWTRSQILDAPDGDLTDMLGVAVDIEGGSIIAGAWWDEEDGIRSGSAYIFEDSGEGDFTFAGKLRASDGMPEATFGRTVAISGSFAVVGAPLHMSAGSVSGAAYLYERDSGGVWSQTAKILPDDLAAGDRFGLALDMDGTTVAIGSSWSDGGRGTVYIFEVGTAGSVTQVARIQPSSLEPGDQFGFDVALDGTNLLVGAYLDDEEALDGGSLWYYENSSGSWALAQGPIVDDALGGADAQLGTSVALDGTRALVGARFATLSDAPAFSGAVVVYELVGDLWERSAYLASDNPQTESEFGWQVALDGTAHDFGVVAALYEDVAIEDDGAAYVLAFNSEFCGGGVLGDVNDDGSVDGADLTILLGSWGVCQDVPCIADLDEDGIVSGTDLTILLGGWS